MTRINGYEVSDPWEEAIARADGPTNLGRKIGMSYQRVKQIQRKEGGVPQRVEVAKRAEAATGVPAAEILRLAPWNPQSRGVDPDDDGGKGSKVLDFPQLQAAPGAPNDVARVPVSGGVRGGSIARPIDALSANRSSIRMQEAA